MKKRLYIIAGFAAAALSLGSCDLIGSIDDIQPDYVLVDGNVIRDAKSAELALNGVYQEWREFDLTAFRVHVGILSGSLTRTGAIAGDDGFAANDVRPENTAIEGIYVDLYAVLNAANYVIDALERGMAVGIDPTRLAEMLGEAKFQRAQAHLMLLCLFGEFWDQSSEYGIVLREVPYRSTDIAPRNSVAECYTSILTDLDAAIAGAPDRPQSHAYVSSTTAKALKARVLLFQKKYPEAARLAAEVVGEAGRNGYELETTDWKQIFRVGWESPEVLFAPYTFDSTESCLISINRTSAGTYTTNIARQWGAELGEGMEDPRYRMTYTEAVGTYKMDKYPYGSNVGVTGNGYFFMRLAEVYLIQAEAEARQGNYGPARTALKVVTGRAGYPDEVIDDIPDNQMLEAIRQHKWLELWAENYEEWFDLVRYHTSGDLNISDVKPSLTSDLKLVLPIPEKALVGNKLLVPNRGEQINNK